MKNDFYNGSGCRDMTAYQAISNVDSQERARELISKIYKLCHEYGFKLESRLVIRDKITNRKYGGR